MDRERLEYLEEWAREIEIADERDLAHRQTVLELIEYIRVLEKQKEV